jgi:hypothetical protein
LRLPILVGAGCAFVAVHRNHAENRYATIREIANAEKINETYVGCVLRLTLLPPDIVEAILSGRQPAGLQLDGLMKRFPKGGERKWRGLAAMSQFDPKRNWSVRRNSRE